MKIIKYIFLSITLLFSSIKTIAKAVYFSKKISIRGILFLLIQLISLNVSAFCPGSPYTATSSITFDENCTVNEIDFNPSTSAATLTINSGVTLNSSNGYPFETGTNGATGGNLVNNGTMASGGNGSVMVFSNFGTITNTGTILRGGFYGAIVTYGRPTISEITNTGAIVSGTSTRTIGGVTFTIPGIYNFGGDCCLDGTPLLGTAGTITTLNNLQGGDTPLTFLGKVPTNYNIIINSSSAFGKLSVVGGALSTGSTTFGIYTGSTVAAGTYASVLTGLTSSNLTSTSGSYSGFNWTLLNSSGTTWDLAFSLAGPTAADTQASLNTQSRRLRSTFNSSVASSNFANMNGYDCNLFDKNNMCISAGGRVTTIDNPTSHHSAAVVVLGYKVSPNIRIGGFLDQSVNHNMPTGVDMSNKNPMMGAFAVWNHQADGLGFQMKLANAYLDKDVTTSRAVIGTSEAGRGRTDLNTQSYVGELSYAFNYLDSTIVRPYFALRYTNIKQDAYTEDTSASVTAPLTYAKLGDRSTTALMGVKLNHALTPRTNLTASLGVEQDINHKTDQLTATGVADLTSENFNNNIKRTRPVVSAGAYYAVAKNQRLSGEVYYQQLPFQSTGSATAYVNYMIGF
jgi:hypothetical protein